MDTTDVFHPEIRERFNEAQKEMKLWMELARWDV